MLVRFYSHIIFLLCVNIFNTVTCEEKSSLSFVIDNTYSMHDDIRQVQENANAISQVVFEEKASLIKNMVLVTFNDPEYSLVTVTENRKLFKNKIDSINVYGGGDCPEVSMRGLLLALQSSLPGSFIYVFTDASAKDYDLSNQVKNMCQKKQSQIVFVLTGYCSNRNEEAYRVYYDIAAACSGLAFDVEKYEVHQILTTIKETIKGNKTVLIDKKIKPHVETPIKFTIDDQTEYAIVTVSGLNVRLSVSGPRAREEKLTWLQNAKAIKLSDLTPGTYTAKVWGSSETSLYIVGRTDFIFHHGFSNLQPKSLKDTTPQPIANTPTVLSIAVGDPKHTVQILTAQILDMKDRVIDQLDLTETSKDFYTTIPFKAPSHRFKIAVLGKGIRTGQNIRRVAKLSVTPQEPERLPTSKIPELTIPEGKTVAIDYSQMMKLTCKVTAYPEPKIEWVDDHGVTLKSQSSVVEPPYKYISYLTISGVTNNGSYTCRAQNKVATRTEGIYVTVKDPFVVKSVPKAITEIKYRAKSTLRCDITSSMPMHIKWYAISERLGTRKELITADGYSISANGTALTINKMELGMNLKYRCEAILDKNPNKTAVYETEVKISGLESPKVTGDKNINALRGSSAQIKCHVTGIPKPTITWFFKADGDSKYILIRESESVLNIKNVDVNQAGTYKCVAQNSLGNNEHHTTFTVQIRPKIVKSSSDVYKGIEGKDAVLNIPCTVTGLPKPVITWKIKGATISENAKYTIKDGTLVIREPKVSDSLVYTCVAKNDAGSDEASFQANVIRLPTPKIPELTILEGKTVEIAYSQTMKLTCKVTAFPEPKIEWIDEHGVTLKSQSSVVEPPYKYISYLTISDVTNNGRYTCRAQNKEGTRTEGINVTVKDPFVVKSVPKGITEIKYGAKGTLRCDITSSMPMHIKWYVISERLGARKELITADGYSISANGTALTINKMELGMNLKYHCVAILDKNPNKTAVYETEVKISGLEKPKVSGEVSKTFVKGHFATIQCKIVKGMPKPTITWYFKGKNSSESKLATGVTELSIPKAEKSHTGIYKCVAENAIGRDELLSKVTVEYAPDIIKTPEIKRAIISNGSVIFEGVKGDMVLRIPCETDGVPKPTVTWKMGGKIIRKSAKYIITDGALIIKEPHTNDSNTYMCEAVNHVGYDSISFIVNVKSNLDKLGPIEEVNVLTGTSTKLECGSTDPSQSVRWFRESDEKKVTGKYFHLPNVDESSEGNYTCRVSDINGRTYTKTFVVIVGIKPEFTYVQEEPIFNWDGTKLDVLDCNVYAKPTPKVTWTYNGKLLKDKTSAELILSDNWGQYSCNVSNVHGSVQRSFKVVSSQCLITRQPEYIKTMPLILTPTSTWPSLESTPGYLKVKSGQTVLFSCPNDKNKRNVLKKLPRLNETIAVCDKQDTFIVANTPYKLSDLQCTEEINPIVKERHMKCLSETSELIRVGFEAHGFLETYEVCFDTSNKIPLYTRALMAKSNRGSGTRYSWSQYHGLMGTTKNTKTNKKDTCDGSLARNCYSKTQLVNARDFNDGPAQKSTFIDPLNAVPLWLPIDTIESPWDVLDYMIRTRLSIYEQFVAWSGTHLLQKINGNVVPRYLWKVLRFDKDNSIAIVYINGPSPSKVDILCTNICPSVPWFSEVNKHTYCCELNEFLQAFKLTGTTIGEPVEVALGKIMSKKN